MWNNTKKFLVVIVVNILSLMITIFATSATAVELKQSQPLNTLADKATQRLLMDIKQVANDRLVAVGERGHIVLSDNQGKTWQQVLVPTSALLTRLFFIDENIGWAVGHQQIILKTQDAGSTWVLQHMNDNLDQPAIFDIWFKSKTQGIAIGAYGLYLKTADGGKTWQDIYQQTLEDEEIGFPHFYSLAYGKESGKLFMAGELGFLAVSDDIGATWKKLDSPYDGSFFHIGVLPKDKLLIMGLRGNLFRSTDLGKSWKKIETGTISGLQSMILMPVSNKVLIVGSAGTQLISDDYGKTVKLIQRSDRVSLANAIVLANQQVMLVGINGVSITELN